MSNCFSTKIDLSLKEKLKEDLLSQGFDFSKPPYTIFSAKKKGVSCTLYESGKLTVQGKEKATFIEFYLEPEILKEFLFSHPEAHLNLEPRIGLDEAGKGDFFGPLSIAGVYADGAGIQELLKMGVGDSKKISDDNVLKLAKKIRAKYAYTVIRLFPTKYNELYAKFKNLNRLLGWAHVAALQDLSKKTSCQKAILDQFADKSLVDNMIIQKKLSVHLEQKVRGEEDLVVAAASILARAAFLEGMALLSEEFGMNIPKGASSTAEEFAKMFIRKFGKEALPRIAKIHFKKMTALYADSSED